LIQEKFEDNDLSPDFQKQEEGISEACGFRKPAARPVRALKRE